jgi:hypothetical protein
MRGKQQRRRINIALNARKTLPAVPPSFAAASSSSQAMPIDASSAFIRSAALRSLYEGLSVSTRRLNKSSCRCLFISIITTSPNINILLYNTQIK